MRWSNILVGLALTGVGASLTPKQYIVEFAADTPDDLRRSGGAKHIKTYNSDLFIGAAIEVTHEDEAQLYASAPHVVNIWRNHALTLDSTSAPDQQSFEHDVAATSWNVHNATGVDQLHQAGILGQDVKVAIIDSGIWYRHDALGGCLGPKCKVAGGHDFSGNDGSGKHPDEDPDDIDGHGTHIAGIIAAVSVDFVGVAPNSTLYAYKVVGSGGGTDDATLIEALLRAYADDMDVVTVSISGSVGWAESAVATVGSRLVRAGIIVTMSAGNAGAEGPFFGGSGGESPDVLTVASVQAAVTPAQAYNLTVVQDGYSRTVRSGYLPSDENFPASVSDWPVVPLSLDPNTAADACQPLPLGSPNLTHAVALVRRGGCTFVQKQQNLQALGAKFILVYNDDRALETPGDTLPDSLLASIATEAGHAILAAIKAGAKVTADFSTAGLVGVKDPSSAGLPSTFTSWASTYDLQLKPDIAAPGGNIYSTWLNNTYQQQSGSSMATPYIAGIGALYISAFGGRKQHGSGFALEFARRVIASGSSLAWYDGTITSSEFKASPMQIGTGLVNAPRVLYANTSLDVVKFNLNDTTNFNPTHDLTITNNGAVAVSYKLRLEPAAGFEIQNLYVPAFSTWGVKQFKELVPISLVPDVQLPPSVELGPGESKKVTVTFSNPENKGWNATVLPAYSGKVIVAGNNGEQLSIAYMGMASSLRENKKVFQQGDPVVLGGSDWVNIDERSSFTFDLTLEAWSFPRLFASFDWGVKELRWDIFQSNWSESDWKYPPDNAVGFIGSTTQYTGDKGVSESVVDAVATNQTGPTPARLLPRNGFYSRIQSKFWWLGTFVNGSQITPGNYTMRIAASKPLGNLQNVDDWEVWRREIQVLPMD